MWIQFTDDEVKTIIETQTMDVQALAKKMQERLDEESSLKCFKDAAHSAHHLDGECEIDDDAVVSDSEAGAYVQAWIWVSNEEAGIPDPEDEE